MKPNSLLQALAAGAVLSLSISLPGHTAGYKEGVVSDGGSISGKLTYEGALPEDAIEKITISKNPDVCDEDGTGYREIVWVDVKDGALRGAFVFIDKVEQGKKWPPPEAGSYMVLQKGCRFRPWAQVVKPGPIIIRHSDPDSVLHNINTREMIGVEKGRVVKRTLFNFGQPEPGDIEKKTQAATLTVHFDELRGAQLHVRFHDGAQASLRGGRRRGRFLCHR